jgi:hypothetical protein
MTPSDDLSTILGKIADGKHTDADIAAVRQLLRTGDRPTSTRKRAIWASAIAKSATNRLSVYPSVVPWSLRLLTLGLGFKSV